jgi:hypothetical protein
MCDESGIFLIECVACGGSIRVRPKKRRPLWDLWVSLCPHCGALFARLADNSVRELTRDERAKLKSRPDADKIRAAQAEVVAHLWG